MAGRLSLLNKSNRGPPFRPDGIQEISDLTGGALDDQVDPPIRQIPHKTGHVESGRQRPHSIAKPHCLQTTRVADLRAAVAAGPTPLSLFRLLLDFDKQNR